ncbi:hypothetical protein [Aquibacillus salsiterrae]|uniref:Uncharacterized protein n=1 Tax=Aquibacillus salsiterrae TaxID=2950439 RepID=A0A9X3WEE0_9BACI|nr:hypothetical protein [Aquibacillus salsiterrae]MDC3417183.1 hypothetical protein [Aquibacillus salsiterrae]
MGYILPIFNFQYNDYHNRSYQPKYNPYQINRIHPSQLTMSYPNEDNRVYQQIKTDKRAIKDSRDDSSEVMTMNELGEHPEKGRYYDRYI